MSKRIKMTVSTGWANGDHVDYEELPQFWDELSEEDKEGYLNTCATDYLNECCDSCAVLVDEDEDDY